MSTCEAFGGHAHHILTIIGALSNTPGCVPSFLLTALSLWCLEQPEMFALFSEFVFLAI